MENEDLYAYLEIHGVQYSTKGRRQVRWMDICGVNLSGILFASKSVNFVGADEGSTTGYYTSPHKSGPMLGIIYTLLCLTSSVVMETSLPTPPTS